MTPYVAVVPVRLMAVPPEARDGQNAVDAISTVVTSEPGCSRGGQEVIAPGGLRERGRGVLHRKRVPSQAQAGRSRRRAREEREPAPAREASVRIGTSLETTRAVASATASGLGWRCRSARTWCEVF